MSLISLKITFSPHLQGYMIKANMSKYFNKFAEANKDEVSTLNFLIQNHVNSN